MGKVLRATDEDDRELLAAIEKETKQAVPPPVNELIGMKKRGATRAELEAFIGERLSDDLIVRRLSMRWLNGETIERDAAGERAQPVLKPASELTGPRQLQPIEKKP